MAILKSIPIHESKGISNVVEYISDKNKTVVETTGNVNNNQNTEKALTYAEDLEKTLFELDGEKSILVSGYNCNTISAPEEFQSLKIKYERTLLRRGIDPASRIKGKKAGTGVHEGELVDKEAREAYHFIMSFSERPDLSPQLVHRIGLEFCEKAFPDTKAVVSTHMNTNHLHNHIVRSAYNMSSATKYRDNMENLKHMRDICNELSLKYGLDILIEDDLNLGCMSGSYKEMEERKKGTSWKRDLQDIITRCYREAKSWDEFKKLMEQNDYGISEKGKYIVYYNLYDDKKRARDTTLGIIYSRDFIKGAYGELPDNNDTYHYKSSKVPVVQIMDSYVEGFGKRNCPKLNLYIPRYTLQGRRRSDLELLFLAAVKIINYFTREIESKTPNQYEKYNKPIVIEPHYLKLRNMKDSANAAIGLGIRDLDHLKELKRKEGAKLSALEKKYNDVKRNLKFSDDICEMIRDVMIIQEALKAKGITGVDMKLLNYSEETIRKKRADSNPMWPDQRKELYLRLNESEYVVACKYELITALEARSIIDFLNGKNDIKPALLIRKDDWAAFKSDRSRRKPGDSEEVINKKNLDFDKELSNISFDDRGIVYRYRILCNDLASYGISESDFETLLKENEELKGEDKKYRKEIVDQKFLYRQYARLEENVVYATDPEYLRIAEYNNIDIVLEEIKKKEEQKRVDELNEIASDTEKEAISVTVATNKESEAEKRKKRNKRNIGWSLVDD